MADMRLLTRFIMRTSRAMSLEARRSQAWEHIIPDMVLKKEYLMHLVLALAGEHFLYEAHLPGVINDSQSALLPGGTHQTQLEYHRMIQHHQKGLEGFRQALSDISPATAEYVFCGAILIVANAFASLSVREHDLTNLGLSNGDDHQGPHIDWLHLVRGLTSVVGDHWYILKLGRLRSFLFYTYGTDDWKQAVPGMYPPRLHHAPRVYSVFAQGASQAISMLRSFATTLPTNNKTTTTTTTTPNQRSIHHPDDDHSSEIDEQYPYDHLNALDKLEIIYMRILYALQFSRSERHCPLSLDIQIDIEESAVTSWPQMVSSVFIAGLQPSEPPFTTAKTFSYIILAHFYTVSVLFKDIWYLNSGFRHEIKRICCLVNELESHELGALMAWPMAVVAES
ncbi:hypothetical protein ASPCADRAFT_179729 [Aspergillus carbonarius ITEM 5010]|uniref:Transcription factor domain-containing protein n=1 Tax=Aspergillus carbonarius (strain ITEM 5010) TaxID=602072 RepID=A0A1R3R6I3_ASPC5|nr:hypothetical protein ASPCADRAFT_179729 [Aspergillus carbonarius ITEM 5010]